MTDHEQDMMERVKLVLTPDLLKPAFRATWSADNPLYGHCYVAAESLYYLLGGKASGYRPQVARDASGITHWWLQNSQGRILDPTAAQYAYVGEAPPYTKGRGIGFLTKEPSQRAKLVISRVSQQA